MALISCPECSNNISEKASKCPHCGFPLDPQIVAQIKKEEQNGCGCIGAAMVVILIIVIVIIIL